MQEKFFAIKKNIQLILVSKANFDEKISVAVFFMSKKLANAFFCTQY